MSTVAARLRSQQLTGPPARDPLAVAERLLAIQAQDPRGARLAIRARTRGLAAADVDRALTRDRTLLITWLNRGTLHLVRSEDYPWLHAITATRPLLTSVTTRLRQEGVSEGAAERGLRAIERALANAGPLTRDQLAGHLAASGVGSESLLHLTFLASLRGLLVRGPVIGKQHAYVLVRDWLGEQPPVDRERALAELARRYLVGHAPASDRDLAYWAGIPLRDARTGLLAIAGELETGARATRTRLPPPRLLGAFDPVLHGWRSREPIAGAHDRRIVSGGVFRPFALVRGRAAGTWRLSGGRVELEPFAPLSRADAAALEADARDVVRYLESAISPKRKVVVDA